ncbi:MAG: hypothetical protein ABF608_07110 [Sporolactobacillus sp.]
MSEEYVLKNKAEKYVLDDLNNQKKPYAERIGYAINDSNSDYISLETVEDWISALKSDMKIVNPLSPREELRSLYFGIEGFSDFHSGINQAIKIIAKEHTDVADWLEDGEQDD